MSTLQGELAEITIEQFGGDWDEATFVVDSLARLWVLKRRAARNRAGSEPHIRGDDNEHLHCMQARPERQEMKVKTISVVYERKWNLGDYNSATVGSTAWADLDEGEDEVAAYAALFAEVKETVKQQSLPLLKKQSAEVKEFFAGLPVTGGKGNNGGEGE